MITCCAPSGMSFSQCFLRYTSTGSTALWLARKMAALGQPLRAGDVLLTGTQAPIADVARGDRLSFSVGGLGEVTCVFA